MSRQLLLPQGSNSKPVVLQAFGRLMRASTILRRELDAEVLRPRGLTLSDFETLHNLYLADDRRLRRVDLVEALMLTPSGVTRLLDGLQEAGLVRNVQCAGDARVTWAQLTDEGVETIECVGAAHAERLRELLCDALSEREVEHLSDLLGKLPGVGAGSCSG